jgi:hypothetical protein
MNKSLIYGTLLGDAWIWKDKNGNYLFAFQQVNKDYAIWKAKQLGFDYKQYTYTRHDKRTNKNYVSTTVHVLVPVDKKRELHNLFYKEKKGVTQQVLNELTPKGICLWYLDDGCMYYNGNNCHLTLAVDAFTENEQQLIITHFMKLYDIKFTKTKKNIRLTSKKECEKFMSLVQRYIPKCMEYKKLSKAIERHKNR